MSKVYSFRLSDDNPREVQAKETISAWTSKGYTLRQIIIEALVNYSSNNKQKTELDIAIKQLVELVNQLNNNKPQMELKLKKKQLLEPDFLDNLRRSVKPGIRSQ